jgi:hypothetical protein
MAATGKRETKVELQLVEISKTLADRDGRPQALVYYAGMRGVRLWNRGRWKEARAMLERTVAVPLPGFAGFSVIRMFDAYVYDFLGGFRESNRRKKRLLVDAAERRDLFTSVNVRTAAGIWLSLVEATSRSLLNLGGGVHAITRLSWSRQRTWGRA